VRDAVTSEPVSAGNSLFEGNLMGISVNWAPKLKPARLRTWKNCEAKVQIPIERRWEFLVAMKRTVPRLTVLSCGTAGGGRTRKGASPKAASLPDARAH
jgi:hypothetical protein